VVPLMGSLAVRQEFAEFSLVWRGERPPDLVVLLHLLRLELLPPLRAFAQRGSGFRASDTVRGGRS